MRRQVELAHNAYRGLLYVVYALGASVTVIGGVNAGHGGEDETAG